MKKLWVFISAIALLAPFSSSYAESTQSISSTNYRKMVESLKVKGKFSKVYYKREFFGKPWFDIDNNNCDTRNDILKRDLKDSIVSNQDSCTVLSGFLKDPYSGKEVTFTRGIKSSFDVQIDHIVPLADAWLSGGDQLNRGLLLTFANDPDNLIAVSSASNYQKGYSTPDKWSPKSDYFCTYLNKYVAVKYKYKLTVSKNEREFLIKNINVCGF
jgi:hypothetical protein